MLARSLVQCWWTFWSSLVASRFSASLQDMMFDGAGGASTSTLEQRLDGWDDSLVGAYSSTDKESRDWRKLIAGAGGHEAVVQSFKQVPKSTVNNPESLLLWLAKYFGILDDKIMFMVLTVAYFNISGGPRGPHRRDRDRHVWRAALPSWYPHAWMDLRLHVPPPQTPTVPQCRSDLHQGHGQGHDLGCILDMRTIGLASHLP